MRARRRAVGAAVALIAVSHGARAADAPNAPWRAPDTIPDRGQPVPLGYKRVTTTDGWLTVGGALMFTGGYVVALTGVREHPLAPVPFVGPLAAATEQDCRRSSQPPCWQRSLASVGYLLAFSAQVSGALVFAVGLTSPPRSVLVRDDGPTGRAWTVVPMVTKQSQGAALQGTF